MIVSLYKIIKIFIKIEIVIDNYIKLCFILEEVR